MQGTASLPREAGADPREGDWALEEAETPADPEVAQTPSQGTLSVEGGRGVGRKVAPCRQESGTCAILGRLSPRRVQSPGGEEAVSRGRSRAVLGR